MVPNGPQWSLLVWVGSPCLGSNRGPNDDINIRIFHSGPGPIPEMMICRSLMFMSSLGAISKSVYQCCKSPRPAVKDAGEVIQNKAQAPKATLGCSGDFVSRRMMAGYGA